jgi:Tfp pilus assembly protein PilF
LIWEGIVLAELSAAKKNMSSLGLVKKTRANFEMAEKIDPSALDWSVYSLLAYLYSHVPGWPIGFGDHKHAQKLYQHAIALNSSSAEPHRNYGEFLLEEKNYTEATRELSFALNAPLRVGEREIIAGVVCNANQCLRYTEETDAAFRDEIRLMLDNALKKAK